jgi:hypothetical protein
MDSQISSTSPTPSDRVILVIGGVLRFNLPPLAMDVPRDNLHIALWRYRSALLYCTEMRRGPSIGTPSEFARVHHRVTSSNLSSPPLPKGTPGTEVVVHSKD